MEVKTFQSNYDLTEFHSYITQINNDYINVVELLLNTNELDFIEKDFANTFIIETDKQTYVFSGYEVDEYYPIENELVKVVCVK